MRWLPLDALVRPAGRTAGIDVKHAVYSVTKHKGFVRSDEYFKKQVYSRDLAGYKRVLSGDFAYATIHLDEGSIGISPGDGLISPMYSVFRPNEALVAPQYLLRFMKSPAALAQYPRFGKGSVHRRKSISLAALGKLSVPLPPLDEQRRIAAILDQADALRAKRRQVLANLDGLTQSIFDEMFRPHSQARWGRTLLGDVVGAIESGTSPNCEARPAANGEWGVLKLSAVTRGEFRAAENKAYLGEVGAMAANEVRSGDVLMTRKNTQELVGAVALVDEVQPRLLLPDLVFRLRLHSDRVDSTYFHALMMSPRMRAAVRVLSSGSAGSMPNISKARLKCLPLEIPPIALQQKYADKVQGISRQRAQTHRALTADNELFASLQSRAFRGEL